MPNRAVAAELPETAAGHGRARTIRGKNVPTRFAILGQDQVVDLLDQLQEKNDTGSNGKGGLRQRVRSLLGFKAAPEAQGRVKVQYAPRLSLFNGQRGDMVDGSQRPFVVSVKRVEGKQGAAHQPIIRIVDEGLRFGLRPELQGPDRVHLDCELTLTRVVNVDTFTFSGPSIQASASDSEAAEPVSTDVTVQIPEVETTRLDASAVLPVGKTLLVGGLRTRDGEGNPRSMLVMLTPTKVVPRPVPIGEPAVEHSAEREISRERPLGAATRPEARAERNEAVHARVYSVADLMVPVPDPVIIAPEPSAVDGGKPAKQEPSFDLLIDLITSTVHPDTWKKAGGVGSIAGYDRNLSLVVSQTREVHEAIIDLLEQLRSRRDVQFQLNVELVQLPPRMVEKLALDVNPEGRGIAMTPREARLLRAYVDEADSVAFWRMGAVTLIRDQRALMPVTAEKDHFPNGDDEVVFQADISEDRRNVELTIAVNPDDLDNTARGARQATVADGQTFLCDISDRMSATTPRTSTPILNRRPDRTRPFRQASGELKKLRTFLLITPKMLIKEEEESRLILGGVTPKIIIDPNEEEELLGISY